MTTRIDRLSSLDQLMLRASRRWPQDIGALVILDGTNLLDPSGDLRIRSVREAIASRMHLAPRLRQVIHVSRRGFGGPIWADATDFDLRNHVHVRSLPPGTDEQGLLELTEELRSLRFDPSRPPWGMWLITGLPEGRVAMFAKLHHAIADGMAAMSTIEAFLDSDPETPIAAGRPWGPAPAPSDRALLINHVGRHLRKVGSAVSALARPRTTLRHAREAWPAIRELFAEEPASRTSLDRMVGPNRSLAVIRTTLAEVKEAGHRNGATVNDVLLSITGGALRTLLRSRGEPVAATTVRIYSPVSLRRGGAGGPQQGNLIAQMAVPLALGVPDAGDRLREVAAETRARKSRARTSLATLLRGRLARRLMLVAVMRQRVNVASASIPGPTEPRYLAGARVLEVFPVLPLIANEPLGVAALSYVGDLTIGIVADRDAFPDLDVFMVALREELDALGIGARRTALVAPEGSW